MSLTGDPIEIILAQRARQRWLCEQLEDIADRLPYGVHEIALHAVHARLACDLPACHRSEEKLYELVTARFPEAGIQLPRAAILIHDQHLAHERFADELRDSIGDGERSLDCERLGYMLRHFFTAITSHLDWEDLVFVQLAKTGLPEQDLAELSASIK